MLPLGLLCALSGQVSAASISPGNLVIYRVGDGSAALTAVAAGVFLDEYTPAGTLVQSIPVSSSGATAMTAGGNATTEGIISRSQDGKTLIFTGYRAPAGTAAVSSTAPASTARVIATLGTSGVIDTSITLTDPTTAIRSATSVDGSSAFWISTAAGLRYVGAPSGSATSVLIDSRNSRQVQLSGNTLFASNGSSTILAKVQSYGSLPTGATVGTTVAEQVIGDAVNGFALFDLNAGVAGDDTLYFLNASTNLLLKYSFNGSAWTSAGSVAASGALNLTGSVVGGNVNLFLTSGSGLYALSDTSGAAGTLTGSLGTAIATAGTNTAFRGIGMLAPVPESSTAMLSGLALALAVSFRRRK